VSGGRSIFVRDAKQLDPMLAGLAGELRSQYLLGYVPANAAQRAPGWHAIDVEIVGQHSRDMRVRARDGYFGR
jgi:hypothetical protein